MSYAVLFPGQGSQFVGMGEELFDRHDDLLGDRSDQILGWSLRQVCVQGPEETLTRTEFAQPALFALSYALWTSWSAWVDVDPSGAAGHSLGEYTALTAAGAVDYESALRLVALRGRLMAEAADAHPSGMTALLGADIEIAEAVVAASTSAGGTLQIANINAPGQIVVAGNEDDLEWLADHGKDHGVRRSIPLKVAGAFHSTYMSTAADGLQSALADVAFGDPRFPVWANATAGPYTAGGAASTLFRQVTSPVLFESSLHNMSDAGIEQFVHIGPGDVTAGLARRTLPEADVHIVSTMDDVGPVSVAVGTM